MKSIKTIYSAVLMALLLSISVQAQSDRYQMYVVHEDQVKEGMMEKHHESDKTLIKAAKDNNLKNMSWITFVAEDNRVMYLTPIANMAELDKNPFDELEDKMGEEAYNNIFESYTDTYTKHGDYILRLDKELSYMPNGITQTPEGENYRELTYYYIPPGMAEKAEELAKSVKKMYQEKNSKIHYRLYKSGFGNMGYYYMVAVAAESPEEMEKKRNENDDLLGDEGKALFDEIENTGTEMKTVTGYIMPELSYVNN